MLSSSTTSSSSSSSSTTPETKADKAMQVARQRYVFRSSRDISHMPQPTVQKPTRHGYATEVDIAFVLQLLAKNLVWMIDLSGRKETGFGFHRDEMVYIWAYAFAQDAAKKVPEEYKGWRDVILHYAQEICLSKTIASDEKPIPADEWRVILSNPLTDLAFIDTTVGFSLIWSPTWQHVILGKISTDKQYTEEHWVLNISLEDFRKLVKPFRDDPTKKWVAYQPATLGATRQCLKDQYFNPSTEVEVKSVLDTVTTGMTVSTYKERDLRAGGANYAGHIYNLIHPTTRQRLIQVDALLIAEFNLFPGVTAPSDEELKSNAPLGRYRLTESQKSGVSAFLNDALNHDNNFEQSLIEQLRYRRRLTWNATSINKSDETHFFQCSLTEGEEKDLANRIHAYTVALCNGVVQLIEARIHNGEKFTPRAMTILDTFKKKIAKYQEDRAEQLVAAKRIEINRIITTLPTLSIPSIPGGPTPDVILPAPTSPMEGLLRKVLSSCTEVNSKTEYALAKFCCPTGYQLTGLFNPTNMKSFIAEVVESATLYNKLAPPAFTIPPHILAVFQLKIANFEAFILENNKASYELLEKNVNADAKSTTVPTLFSSSSSSSSSASLSFTHLSEKLVSIFIPFIHTLPEQFRVDVMNQLITPLPLWQKMINQHHDAGHVIQMEIRRRLLELTLIPREQVNELMESVTPCFIPVKKVVEQATGAIVGAPLGRPT